MARPEKSKKIEEGIGAQSATPSIDQSNAAQSNAAQSNVEQSDIEQSALESTADQQSPTIEQIERRAYDIYLERGSTDGNDTDDWLRAERELRGTEENQDLS